MQLTRKLSILLSISQAVATVVDIIMAKAAKAVATDVVIMKKDAAADIAIKYKVKTARGEYVWTFIQINYLWRKSRRGYWWRNRRDACWNRYRHGVYPARTKPQASWAE
jgi:hypothetical protein